jgi:GH35 family endo-1,4-beta-xylanase
VQHRTGEAVVRLLGADGAALANTDVTVEQHRHAFAFGNIGFDFLPLANGEARHSSEVFGGASQQSLEHLAELWLDLFNTATLPFYWRGFEPVEGSPDTERLRTTARWFADRGVAVKGHPLVWHTLTPEWLDDRSIDEVKNLQRARIRREVSDFAGLIDTWDAINEVVIMPVFDKDDNGITRLACSIGRIPMIRLAFAEARLANPNAVLLLNDFDLSSAYECLIEGVLEAGIQIDAIGLQTHMHQGYWGEDAMLAMVDRFARFGLPLHLTESTLLSGHLMPKEIVDLNDYQIPSWPSTPEGEARQADEIVRHYRSLLSHPAIETVNYWGVTDDGSWLGAPVGLVRSDGTRKPSYDALHSLIKGEWWLGPTVMRTDDEGVVRVTGWRGDYTATAKGVSTPFTIG